MLPRGIKKWVISNCSLLWQPQYDRDFMCRETKLLWLKVMPYSRNCSVVLTNDSRYFMLSKALLHFSFTSSCDPFELSSLHNSQVSSSKRFDERTLLGTKHECISLFLVTSHVLSTQHFKITVVWSLDRSSNS